MAASLTMVPPMQPLNLDIEAISGITGSISIACWILVFSPQIIENFRRRAADGLSLPFVVAWLLGDVCNLLGAVLQGVLPTMIILAIYYTFADLVLLGQCLYYRCHRAVEHVSKNVIEEQEEGEEAAVSDLLPHCCLNTQHCRSSDHHHHHQSCFSPWSAENLAHLSPTVPLLPDQPDHDPPTSSTPLLPATKPRPRPPTTLQTTLWNTTAVLLVCLAGMAGWFLSRRYSSSPDHSPDTPPPALTFNPLGQFFGYLCATLYLSSRIPQLVLNWRRQSTEGVSLLFFLFAYVGNLMYVCSVLAFDPRTGGAVGSAGGVYGRYVLVNLPWLLGSAGALALDTIMFGQFWGYGEGKEEGAWGEG